MVDRDKDVVRQIIREELEALEARVRELARKELADIVKEIRMQAPVQHRIHDKPVETK